MLAGSCPWNFGRLLDWPQHNFCIHNSGRYFYRDPQRISFPSQVGGRRLLSCCSLVRIFFVFPPCLKARTSRREVYTILNDGDHFFLTFCSVVSFFFACPLRHLYTDPVHDFKRYFPRRFIVLFGGELFTGNTMYMLMAFWSKRATISDIFTVGCMTS